MIELSELYDSNYSEWAKKNAELLKARRFSELDVTHLIEELSDMSKSEQNELESRLLILITHLLKWQYQYQQLAEKWQEFKGDSWRATIVEQRGRIERRLRESPGLKSRFSDAIMDVYSDAVNLATKETRLPKSTFPTECPYTIPEILDENFYPASKK